MKHLTEQQIRKKRDSEKRIVTEMIRIYCHGHHHAPLNEEGLCPQCEELAQYARVRAEHCPFMETKTFCSNCRVHCYSPEMKSRIREVMKYAGPRMLFYHPLLTIYHGITFTATKLRRRFAQ